MIVRKGILWAMWGIACVIFLLSEIPEISTNRGDLEKLMLKKRKINDITILFCINKDECRKYFLDQITVLMKFKKFYLSNIHFLFKTFLNHLRRKKNKLKLRQPVKKVSQKLVKTINNNKDALKEICNACDWKHPSFLVNFKIVKKYSLTLKITSEINYKWIIN